MKTCPTKSEQHRRAIIMAGGEGQRLRPFTNTIPKPLLPIGRKPVAQVIIERLKTCGFEHITMALGYGADLVRAYFRDGSQFGIKIDYVSENQKLGTAGALTMIEDIAEDESVLVTNGDVLTDIDYRAFMQKHESDQAIMTVGAVKREMICPYGVLDVDGETIRNVREKPKFEFIANAGIYAISAKAISLIPQATQFDMTELINKLRENQMTVNVQMIDGFWFDLATVDDFDLASKQIEGFVKD